MRLPDRPYSTCCCLRLPRCFHAVSRSTSHAELTATFEVDNLTDARVYDVLGVQRPGRAAFFKLMLCWDCSAESAALPTDLNQQ